MFLRQSTASQEVMLGRFVDSTDGNSEEVGLTIANTDIKLFVGGATTLASKNSGGGTHVANGMYSAVLDATDTATVGLLEIHVHVAGALSVRHSYYVLEEVVYDAMFAASAAGYQVPIWAAAGSTVSLSATTIATTTTATNVTTVNGLAANVLTAAATAADFATELRTAINGGDYPLNTSATGSIRVVDGTGTDEINTTSGSVTVTVASVNVIADQVWEEALGDHNGTPGSTAEALGAAGSAGDPWITALPGAYVAGSAGFIVGTNLNATISSRASQASLDTIDSIVDSILADTGTDGVVVNAAGLQTDAVNEIRNAITGFAGALSTDASGMIRIVDGTGTGEINTSSGTVLLSAATEAQIDAIEADTNELQVDWVNGGRLDLLIDAIKAKSDLLPGSPAAVGSAMTLTSGERDSIAAALLDLTSGIETGVTPRQALRAISAKSAGLVSGAGTGTEVIKGIGQASGGTTRLTATVDASGNITAWTLAL